MTIFQAYSDLVNRLIPLYEKREAGNIADWVLEKITGYQKIDRLMHREDPLSASQQATLQQFTDELLSHRPVQYVLGECWFAGRKFLVNESVLIPRPETEELVDWILHDMRLSSTGSKTLLDIGTGSGCIAIALKTKYPTAVLSALDISPEALSLARENARRNEADIRFVQCNVLNRTEREKLPQVDIIVSNPPYIPQKDKVAMHHNVLQYEPHLALFVEDDDPLLFYREIADLARERLVKGGAVYFEIHEKLGEQVVDLLTEKGFDEVELKKDLQGKDRMIKGIC